MFVRLTDSTRQNDAGDRPYGFRLQVAFWTEPTPDGLYPDPFDPARGPPQVMPIVEEFDNTGVGRSGLSRFLSDTLARQLVTRDGLANLRPAQRAARSALRSIGGGHGWLSPVSRRLPGSAPDPLLRTGLAALEAATYGDVALVVAPGANGDIVTAVIEHCERIRYRFAIVDTPAGQANAASIDPRATWDTARGFYTPGSMLTILRRRCAPVPPKRACRRDLCAHGYRTRGVESSRQRDSDRSHRPRICGE